MKDSVDETAKSAVAPILRFLSLSEDGLFPVEIQKILFYADCCCVEQYGKRLTRVEYEPMMYGAYSEDVRDAIDYIENGVEDLVTKAESRNGTRDQRYILLADYESVRDTWEGFPATSDDHSDADVSRNEFIQSVYRRISGKTIADLTEISKDNYLYQNTNSGESLSFEAYLDALDEGTATRTASRPRSISEPRSSDEEPSYPLEDPDTVPWAWPLEQ